MQDQVGLDGFLQGGPKCSHQLMRQVADEPHGIGEHRGLAGRQGQLPERRVQRGEQLIGRVDLAPGQSIEQRRLTRVGVTDEGDRRRRIATPGLPAQLATGADLVQTALKIFDALRQQTPVGFQLGLAGATQADAALLALQM